MGWPYCHPTTLWCSECLNDGDCATSGEPYCAISGGKVARCVQCTADSHCALASGNTGHCNVAKGTCTACTQDTDCVTSGLGVACVSSTCRQCFTHADCPVVSSSTTLCTATGKCLGCTSKADCNVIGTAYSCCDPGPPFDCIP
ncbi:MAG: hypothetical protein ACYTFN_21325 [Planctomycetota bacterium]